LINYLNCLLLLSLPNDRICDQSWDSVNFKQIRMLTLTYYSECLNLWNNYEANETTELYWGQFYTVTVVLRLLYGTELRTLPKNTHLLMQTAECCGMRQNGGL
jgi:hypothetical protein